ncbi:MAG: response regulator, partial [Pseudomonadota bacterium]
MSTIIDEQDSPLVLLADDDATMRVLVRHTLHKAGFRIEELDDGPEVVKVFQEIRPDIVMLDVMMPSMNGFDVCAALRELPTGRHVPILMVTGLDDDDSINQAYEAGATDFITKPITFPLLGHRLRYTLRASQAMENLGKSEAGLANAQAIAHLGSWEWDAATRAVTWSDESYRIFGYEPQSLSATEELVFKALHPEDFDKFVDTSEKCFRTGEPNQIDYRVILPNGKVRIVNQQFEAVRDKSGKTVTLQGTFQDITERKQVENELRQYRLHLEDLVEQRTAELQKAKELAEQANELKDKFVS